MLRFPPLNQCEQTEKSIGELMLDNPNIRFTYESTKYQSINCALLI